MSGTIVQTHERRGDIGLFTFTCTADAADGSFPQEVLSEEISGKLLALETNPGSPAPTDNYDVAIADADGRDVLETVGQNRDTVTTEKAAIVFSGTSINPPVSNEDTLTLAITGNVVNSAVVVVKLYYEGTNG